MPHSCFLYSKREIHQVLDVLLLKTQKLDLLIQSLVSVKVGAIQDRLNVLKRKLQFTKQ